MNDLNPDNLATLSLLRGGYGVGVGPGHGYQTREPFDGTVVNNNVNRNNDDIKTQNDFTRDLLREQGSDAKFQSLLAQINENRQDMQRDIADARAEAAKCCCDTQLMVVKENNDTRVLLLEQQIKQGETDAARAQTSLLASQNERILAELAGINSGGHGHGGGGRAAAK